MDQSSFVKNALKLDDSLSLLLWRCYALPQRLTPTAYEKPIIKSAR